MLDSLVKNNIIIFGYEVALGGSVAIVLVPLL